MRRNENEAGEWERGELGGGASTAHPLGAPPAPSPPAMSPRPSAEFCLKLVASFSWMEGYARRLTPNRSDAADLAQATCLRALENWNKFVTGSAAGFKKWLATIMANQHLDGLRKRRREVLTSELDALPDGRVPEEALPWQDLKTASVNAAVRTLPRPLQEAYVLFSFDLLSYAEISTRVNAPARTVGSRIFRARALLRSTLSKDLPAEVRGSA
jgi:RNA polymerase sigma-70 factor (ECF subfamily)